MGIKIIKLVAACSLLILLSACGGSGGGSSTPAAAVDNSLTVSPLDEQATLKNVAKTVTLSATDSSFTQAITFDVTSSNVLVTPSVSDSTLTLTPATDFVGTSTISVRAYDGTLYSAAQTFTFTVCDSACAPVLTSIPDATIGTLINTATSLSLNGTDANSDSLTYSATSSSTDVVPSISGTTLTLTPATDWTGTATITAKASDAALDSIVKTFTFKVCATACLPTLVSVSNQTTTEDTAKAITLVGADPESDALTYTATSSTTNVTTTISGSTLTLNPKLNWSGSATITAKTTDGDGISATRTFTLTTSAVNDVPVLASVTNQTTTEEGALNITLVGTDVEGSSLTYSATSSNSSNVTTSISGAILTLTPATDFNGSVTITAKVNDGTVDSALLTFTLTVSAVNDAPVVGTVANQTTAEDTAKTVTLSETDVDTGDSHTFTATSSTSNVTPSISGATLTLTPATNWSGTATITIKANDGTVDSAAKTFTLTVSAVNDVPVLASVTNQVTVKNTAKTVTLSGTDAEGSSLTYSATTSASQITIGVSGAVLTLTPDNNWTGTSTITAKVNDGTVDSATQQFTLTVNASNTAPVVGSVSAQSTNEDTAKTVTLSGTDTDDDSLTYSATSAESEVTPSVSGTTLTLTPDANWNGTSVITIKANDAIVDSAAKTFTLTVTAINDAPVVGTVANQSTTKNSAKTVNLSETDADAGDSHTFTATTSASQITIGISGAALTMTPDNNWTGTSTITIKANDGTVDSAAKTFVLTVSESNATPTLASISAQATNQSVKETVSITAADSDGDSLSYTVTSSPSSKVSGSVSGSTLTLTPLASYNGTAAVTLTVSDGTATAARTFNLVVTANDPLYEHQWHLDNTGQKNFASTAGTAGKDINVDSVITDGYTGTGVVVGVIDEGLELAHEDLSANIVSGGSWDFKGNDNDPTNTNTDGVDGDHGSSVAGLIASAGWNGKGGRGVAPSASLRGFNFIRDGVSQTTAQAVNSYGGASYSSPVHIFNASIGSTFVNSQGVVNTTVEAQFLEGVTNLRSGKGAIYVKSAGNEFNSAGGLDCGSSDPVYYPANDDLITCGSAQFDPNNTLPYLIVVGATTATDIKSSYSSTGSNVWVSAPGGEQGANSAQVGSGYVATVYQPTMMTVDQSGCSQGYVKTGTSATNPFNNAGNHSSNTSCNYHSRFNGTSSAAPVTSGVVALMLEANAALTSRDVKHILATTSTQIDASKANITLTVGGATYIAEPSWLTNGAGHKFHNWYGFGRVDAAAAVAAAKAYSAGSLGSLTTTSYQTVSNINTAIPDYNATGLTNTMTVSGANVIEAVQVKLNVSHTYAGDLAVELTSPAGTKSVLLTPMNSMNYNNHFTNLVLTSNAFYGESKAGDWTLRMIDAASGTTGGLLNWSIRFFGH